VEGKKLQGSGTWIILKWFPRNRIAKPKFCSEHGQVVGTLKIVDEISSSLAMEFLEYLRNCKFILCK